MSPNQQPLDAQQTLAALYQALVTDTETKGENEHKRGVALYQVLKHMIELAETNKKSQ